MNLITKPKYIHLVANVVDGVYREYEIDYHFMPDWENIEDEEDFYNQLADLDDEEIIYCLFQMHSEVYNKIDKEYGIS